MNTRRYNSLAYNPLISGFMSFIIGTIPMEFTQYVNGYNGFTYETWPMLVGFLLTLLWPINVHAYHEAYTIEVKRIHITKSGHRLRFVVRALVFVVFGTLVHWFAEREFTNVTLVRISASVVLMGSWFWLIFDYALNHHRDYALNYIGKSGIDRIFFKMGWVVMLLCKVLLFAFSVWLYLWVIQESYRLP